MGAASEGGQRQEVLETLSDAAPRIAVGLGVALGLWLVGRLLGAGVRRRWLARGRPSFAHVMSRVVTLSLTTLGLLIAVTIILPSVQPVNVLGSLGFFSIAVGFAFRDILENLLAGILLLFRAPFRIGDEVDVEGTRGTVVEINLRETVIRSYDGRQVLIPNAQVYKSQLVVQTGYPAVRTEVVVGVAYESDLDVVHDVALETLRATDGVLADPPPHVLVSELGASTIDLQLLFWTAPQQATVLAVRDRVLTAVVVAFGQAGVEMPADVLVLQGTPSLRAALRDDDLETTQAGSLRRRSRR